MNDVMEPLLRLDRDMKQASRLMGLQEASWLVRTFYEVQEFRKASANQVRSTAEGEPNRVQDWVAENMRRLEDDIKRSLDVFTDEWAVSRWMKSHVGVGPVLAAGFISTLDIRKAKTAGHFISFAGLNPDVKWEKKTKRPWNAFLKTHCWKWGEVQVKFCNHERSFYGPLYAKRKALEIERNDRLQFADQAKESLATKNFGKDTEARKHYEAGKLPPARIHLRAMRWIEKLWISHLHHAMYLDYYGVEPPAPYIFVYGPTGVATQVLARDKHLCAYCGAAASKVDHIMPKPRGGLDTSINMVACCLPCNQKKADKTPLEAGMHFRADFDQALLSMPINDAGDHRHYISPPNLPWSGGGRPLRELLDQPIQMTEANPESESGRSD